MMVKPAVRWGPPAAAALLLVIFVLANAPGLGSTPLINEDETWIAAPGVEFFTSGHFATRLFAGYFGSERYYYDFMPLYSLIDGAAIKAFGMSLVTVRSLSLLLATITLLLTYLVGRRLLSAWHGVLAMLILASWPVAAPGAGPSLSHLTGIPLTDLGRIGRYDILVPVFGLASLLAFLRGLDSGARPQGWLMTSGTLAALATLTHYYGLVWLIVIGALVFVAYGRRAVGLLKWPALGFALTMTPWLWFVSLDFAAFIAQKQTQVGQYVRGLGSVPSELSRYAPVVSAAGQGHLASVLWIGAALAGVVLLVRAGWRQHLGARLLSITIVVLLISFALLVRRSYHYLATVWPLLALAASYALLHAWPSRLRTAARAVLVVLVVIASSAGVRAYGQLALRARETSAYSTVCDRIAQMLPPSARLLALQHWWFGVGARVADYRSFQVPLTRMNPRVTAQPITFEAAMAIDPMDFILIDPEMADVLLAAGDPARPKASPFAIEIVAFLKQHAVAAGGFDDQTYGRFTLYRVK